jgi:hypothetical protein
MRWLPYWTRPGGSAVKPARNASMAGRGRSTSGAVALSYVVVAVPVTSAGWKSVVPWDAPDCAYPGSGPGQDRVSQLTAWPPTSQACTDPA